MSLICRATLVVSLAACTPAQPDPGQPTAPTPLATPTPAPTPTPKPVEPIPIDASAIAQVKNLWDYIGSSSDSCGGFDYFPNGGMKSFACHLDLDTNLGWLTEASKMPVFLNGPHEAGKLDLNNRNSFGRYNPKFVRWMVAHLVPAASDPDFRKATQSTYDKFVKPLAKTFLVTYEKFADDPACLKAEVDRYQAFLDGAGVPNMDYERYFFFMNEEFCDNPDGGFDYFTQRGFDGGHDGNVVKTCTAFWIRRTIDGTAEEFYKGLVKLIDTYEPSSP